MQIIILVLIAMRLSVGTIIISKIKVTQVVRVIILMLILIGASIFHLIATIIIINRNFYVLSLKPVTMKQ